jgi:hypothetical protein
MSEKYFTDPRINASLLKMALTETPRRLQWLRANGKTSDALKLGTEVHSALEHQGKMSDKLIISPYDAYQSKDAKKWKADQEEAGLTPIKQKEYDKIKSMVSMVWNNCPTFLRDIIQSGSTLREHEVYSEKFKSLEDIYCPQNKIILDYKSTAETTPEGFKRSCYKFKYDLQAFHYLMNHEDAQRFIIIGVSSAEPHELFPLEASASFLAHGEHLFNIAMENLDKSIAPPELEMIDAPPWWTETPSSGEDLSTFY